MGGYDLGEYDGVSRSCQTDSWPAPTWLSNKQSDINELDNLAMQMPEQLQKMQQVLRQKLIDSDAPAEQLQRLGIA